MGNVMNNRVVVFWGKPTLLNEILEEYLEKRA